ncbi:hypothetical protein SDC9_104025 [bioreactor metagenome]|uniref:Uncharacterized protein n=1 Tax=bioreactor metagenome TaxID=1076179 RepID=A0A645B208_9ZZZZ
MQAVIDRHRQQHRIVGEFFQRRIQFAQEHTVGHALLEKYDSGQQQIVAMGRINQPGQRRRLGNLALGVKFQQQRLQFFVSRRIKTLEVGPGYDLLQRRLKHRQIGGHQRIIEPHHRRQRRLNRGVKLFQIFAQRLGIFLHVGDQRFDIEAAKHRFPVALLKRRRKPFQIIDFVQEKQHIGIAEHRIQRQTEIDRLAVSPGRILVAPGLIVETAEQGKRKSRIDFRHALQILLRLRHFLFCGHPLEQPDQGLQRHHLVAGTGKLRQLRRSQTFSDGPLRHMIRRKSHPARPDAVVRGRQLRQQRLGLVRLTAHQTGQTKFRLKPFSFPLRQPPDRLGRVPERTGPQQRFDIRPRIFFIQPVQGRGETPTARGLEPALLFPVEFRQFHPGIFLIAVFPEIIDQQFLRFGIFAALVHRQRLPVTLVLPGVFDGIRHECAAYRQCDEHTAAQQRITQDSLLFRRIG